METFKLNNEIQRLIENYFKLTIGGKEIVCPYFINKKSVRGNLRVMAGKGSPEEIELESKIWAKVRDFDLNNATTEEVRAFLQQEKIGIDCSGFIAQILSTYMKETNQGKLVSKLKFEQNNLFMSLRRKLRPIENIGAKTLTSELNCEKIDNLNDIKPGDLIRAKGKQKNAQHIGMVVEVVHSDKVGTELGHDSDTIVSFKYVNSHRYYGDKNGVRYGEVIITDQSGGLKDQDWKDTHSDGINYFLEDLLVEYEDNGIRRPMYIKYDN